MQLNQMNAMRYVTPFKSEVVEKISLIADVADIIEKWLKLPPSVSSCRDVWGQALQVAVRPICAPHL